MIYQNFQAYSDTWLDRCGLLPTWFERNLIGIVPLRYAGALRRVYPGFVQLAAFMSMNLDRHVKAQIDLFLPSRQW